MDFRITIEGTAPLLMHNSRLANPLDPAAKELKRVTGKRKKTDDDYAEAARLEHLGGLYLDPDVGPYIPGDNIWRSLLDAARKHRMGPKIEGGVLVTTDVNPLAYPGPRTAEALWGDENFRHMASVKVQKARLMRCRPIFRQWRTEATGVIDPSVIDLAELAQVAETAGTLIGLGDWRPRYGRYAAQVEKI